MKKLFVIVGIVLGLAGLALFLTRVAVEVGVGMLLIGAVLLLIAGRGGGSAFADG